MFAGILCALALLGKLLGRLGESKEYPALGAIVAVYIVSGFAGGILLGLFRRRIGSRIASTVVGFVVAIPAASAITFSMPGPEPLAQVFVLALLGAGVGFALGPG
jgi:hypothetical protein